MGLNFIMGALSPRLGVRLPSLPWCGSNFPVVIVLVLRYLSASSPPTPFRTTRPRPINFRYGKFLPLSVHTYRQTAGSLAAPMQIRRKKAHYGRSFACPRRFRGRPSVAIFDEA